MRNTYDDGLRYKKLLWFIYAVVAILYFVYYKWKDEIFASNGIIIGILLAGSVYIYTSSVIFKRINFLIINYYSYILDSLIYQNKRFDKLTLYFYSEKLSQEIWYPFMANTLCQISIFQLAVNIQLSTIEFIRSSTYSLIYVKGSLALCFVTFIVFGVVPLLVDYLETRKSISTFNFNIRDMLNKL